MINDSDDLLTISEVARLRDVTRATVTGWIDAGRIQVAGRGPSPHPCGPRIVRMFRRADALAATSRPKGRPQVAR